MPNKAAVVRFHSLPDTIDGICRNKQNFLVDITDFTHAGEKRWGLVFYGVKSKLLAYYRLGSEDPIATLTLYALGQ